MATDGSPPGETNGECEADRGSTYSAEFILDRIHLKVNSERVLTTAVDLSVLARVGTALSDESRRRILVRLLDGPAFPADLAEHLGLPRPSVSNHLSCLLGCGIVVKRREGRNVRYEISDPRLAHALGELCEVMLGPAVGCEHEGADGCG